MDSKTQGGQRATTASGLETKGLPKSKVKDKARKELWDSLCAVYENEATIENGQMEMEDIDVDELEKWTVNNTDTSMRALTKLAVTDPNILFTLSSLGNTDSVLESELENCEVQVINKKRNYRTNNCRCKSSSTRAKPFKNSEAMPKKKNLSNRRKVLEKEFEGKDLKIHLRKMKEKQRSRNLEESNNIAKVSKYLGFTKHEEHQSKTKRESLSNHNCNLEYHYYSKEKNVSVRPDNRVFNCKLIFKNINGEKKKLHPVKGNGDANCDNIQTSTKLSEKEQSRLKKKLLNENNNITGSIAKREVKERLKLKELKRRKKVLNAAVAGYIYQEDDNVPSVIVLHNHRRGLSNNQTINDPSNEGVNSLSKPNDELGKNQINGKMEEALLSHKPTRPCETSSYRNMIETSNINESEMPGINYRHRLKNKSKNKSGKGMVYKTLSSSLKSKVRRKSDKVDKKLILKEVANTLNANIDIFDNIKNLPIKVDENQLIFMHPSHIKKALGHINHKNDNYHERPNPKSSYINQSESRSNLIDNIKEKSEPSHDKPALENVASSKRLRELSSCMKKVKKSVAMGSEENCNIAFRTGSGNNKEHKKRRKKSKFGNNDKSVLEELDCGENARKTKQVKVINNLTLSENDLEQNCSDERRDVCFKNSSFDVSDVQNVNFDSTMKGLKIKLKNNKIRSNLKNSLTKEKRLGKQEKMEFKEIAVGNEKYFDGENQISSSFGKSEGKKLTFQLLKTNLSSRHHGRIIKSDYSISNRTVSKENIIPEKENDRLYVTKRMLFYSNKESSSTSKESLNIAIRRDTEISDNGISNNVLNVVIKQKKNSGTSTNSINSPKSGLKNQCSKHCDTRSLEKLFLDSNIQKMCNNSSLQNFKEAVCQTEENKNNTNGEGKNISIETAHVFELDKKPIPDKVLELPKYQLQNNNHINCRTTKNTFQPVRETIIPASFGDNYKNILERNRITCTPELNLQYMQELNSKSYLKPTLTPVIKPFINSNNGLNKTKCDDYSCSRKVNTPHREKIHVSKGILKLNIKTREKLCPKPELENIAEKLKNIGLCDQKSFVKVISSSNKLENSINIKKEPSNMSDCNVVGDSKKQKCYPPKDVDIKENVITRRQRNQFTLTKNQVCPREIQNDDPSYCLYKKSNTSKSDVRDLEMKSCRDWGNIIGNFQVIENNHLKLKKQNFVHVLKGDEFAKEYTTDKTIQKPHHLSKLKQNTSHHIMNKYIVSEVGVQTESSGDFPTVSYKNVPFVQNHGNSRCFIKNGQVTQDTGFLKENTNSCSRNKFQQKASFIHVINKKSFSGTNLKKDILKENKTQVSCPLNNFEQKNDFKQFNDEKQVIDKINAVHNFLMYLDKMIKDNSFVDLDKNKKSNFTIGHFNSTLRCLCNNCVEILNKVEIKELKDKNKNLKTRKSFENSNSRPGNQNIHIVKPINGAKNKHSLNVNWLSCGEHLTLSSGNLKSKRQCSSDLTLKNSQSNPFCVVLTQDEKSYQQKCNTYFECFKGCKSVTMTKLRTKEKQIKKHKSSYFLCKPFINKTTNLNSLHKCETAHNKINADTSKVLGKIDNSIDSLSSSILNKCFQSKPFLKKAWVPKVSSSLEFSLNKYDTTANRNALHCTGLSSGIVSETAASEKKTGNKKVSPWKKYFKSISQLKNTQLNIKTNSSSFSNVNKDCHTNCNKLHDNKEIKNIKILRFTELEPVNTHKKLKGSFLNLNTQHESIIITEKKLSKHKDKEIRSYSVEYLNKLQNINEYQRSEEDEELESDGWVRLDDIKEIKNNQICFGMEMKNMIVNHVEYVQKFPETPSHCKQVFKEKENMNFST